MDDKKLEAIDRLLVQEGIYVQEVKETAAAERLNSVQSKMIDAIRDIGRRGDIALIIATEREFLQGDLDRYANSSQMKMSITNALAELAIIDRHLGVVDDKAKYKVIDTEFSLSKNRRNGLPDDEARQSFRSHYTRLNNLDKARLSDNEKNIIDARKTAIFIASRRYAEHQARALGVNLAEGKKRGSHL